MNQQSEHLSNAQIEDYGKRPFGAGPDQSDEVDQHLADCSSCRSRLLDFQRTHLGLLEDPKRSAGSEQLADPKVNTASTPECPGQDDLRRLAAGLCSDELAGKLIQHAAGCDHCGHLLNIYSEDFSDEFTPEQQAVLTDLKSASPSWQSQTAREMLAAAGAGVNASIRTESAGATEGAGTAERAATAEGAGSAAGEGTRVAVPHGKSPSSKSSASESSAGLGRKAFPWRWVLVPAAAAACALVAFSVWYGQRDTPEKVEKLLAQAYTEQRTMEMRWPGAKWAEVQTTRGQTSISKPLALLEADDAIQRQTPETQSKPEWLHLRVQSEVLNGIPPEQLIRELRNTIQRQQNASLILDLAITDFRIGESTRDSRYYLESKMLLDEILKRSPSDSVALFNRAIVEGRLNLRDPSAADLNASLKLEKDPAWSKEIQRKIKELP